MRPVRSAGSPVHSHRQVSANSSGFSISSSGTPWVRPWWSTPGVVTRPDGRQHVDRDAVGVDLGGQAGGEALERGLAHAVDRAAPHAPPRVGRALGVAAGARGDVEDPARAPLASCAGSTSWASSNGARTWTANIVS